MAVNRNAELMRELREATLAQYASDALPSSLSSQIVPVIEVNPNALRKVNFTTALQKTTSGSGTIYALPIGKQLYITGVTISYEADATSDCTLLTVTAPIGGAYRTLAGLTKLTTSAGKDSISVTFPFPLMVDPSTIVSAGSLFFNFTFTVGNITAYAVVHGHLMDSVRG